MIYESIKRNASWIVREVSCQFIFDFVFLSPLIDPSCLSASGPCFVGLSLKVYNCLAFSFLIVVCVKLDCYRFINANFSATNQCAVGNGNCSQLCIPQPGNSRVCYCTAGFQLDRATKTKCEGIFLLLCIDMKISCQKKKRINSGILNQFYHIHADYRQIELIL